MDFGDGLVPKLQASKSSKAAVRAARLSGAPVIWISLTGIPHPGDQGLVTQLLRIRNGLSLRPVVNVVNSCFVSVFENIVCNGGAFWTPLWSRFNIYVCHSYFLLFAGFICSALISPIVFMTHRRDGLHRSYWFDRLNGFNGFNGLNRFDGLNPCRFFSEVPCHNNPFCWFAVWCGGGCCRLMYITNGQVFAIGQNRSERWRAETEPVRSLVFGRSLGYNQNQQRHETEEKKPQC